MSEESKVISVADEIDPATETKPANAEKEELIKELTELSGKIDRLRKFMNGYNSDGIRKTTAAGLTDAAVYLLHLQEKAMVDYYNCLSSRLSIWDYTIKEDKGE